MTASKGSAGYEKRMKYWLAYGGRHPGACWTHQNGPQRPDCGSQGQDCTAETSAPCAPDTTPPRGAWCSLCLTDSGRRELSHPDNSLSTLRLLKVKCIHGMDTVIASR